MRTTQLRAFDLVAREGSFSGAADQAGLTQPALTIQVRNLEQTYGIRLFIRSGDGARLTSAGEDLFRLTREMFETQDRIGHFLAASRDLETGVIRLSADGPHLATRIIALFRTQYPGVQVSLALGNAPEVWDDLAEARADAVIAAGAKNVAANHLIALQESRLVVLVAADHPWARQRGISIRRLAGQPSVLRERRSNTRRTVDRLLRENNVSLGDRLELGSREAVIEAVAAGLGIGFIFASETTPDPRVRAITLRDAEARNSEVAACLQSQRNRHVVRAFMETAASWRASNA